MRTSTCGSVFYQNLTLQWTRNHDAAERAIAHLKTFGAPVTLHAAPGTLEGHARIDLQRQPWIAAGRGRVW